MKEIAPPCLPRMRELGLVIDDLPDEVLVYDLERHKAHCLNRTAGLVWRQCDGRTTPTEIARRLRSEFPCELTATANEDLVWLALRQLEKLHLLEQSISLPTRVAGISRRQLLRSLGIATAVAVPMVTSLIAPTPAQAGTCVSNGNPCNPNIGCCGSCMGTMCVG